MKVVHLNTLDTGGAATAAYRVHNSLQAAGVDSTMLVLQKKPSNQDDSVKSITEIGRNDDVVQRLFQRWNSLLTNYPKRPKGLELFSDACSSVHLDNIPEIAQADIIHLHWVAGFLNYKELATTFAGKRIVWTLHDMNAFTGGCHYAGKCTRYRDRCGSCPQLGSIEVGDLSRRTWLEKSAAIADIDLTMVTPSRWLGECLGNSSLMGNLSRSIIPYGLSLERFHPMTDPGIRRQFNIPDSARIVLFGADDTSNPRKGLSYLINAFRQLEGKRYNAENLHLLVFGDFFKAPKGETPFKVIPTGRIDDPATMARLYAAADVFVLPSLEDNLPNTAIESIACGTPVVAFKSGGIVDIIDHKQTGYMAEIGNARQLAEGIDWILSSYDQGVSLSENCRRKAESTYAYDIQARAYVKVYGDRDYIRAPQKTRSADPSTAWPKITVVTPSFNQTEYLEDCILSVLNQDYPDIEYIIMDGGSEDGSVDIIKKYEHRLAYWQSKPDEGQYAAIQAGFERGSGEIMTWINADDMLHPKALKYVAAIFMQRPDVHWVTGRPNGIGRNGERLWVLPTLPLWSRRRYLNKQYKSPYIQQEGTFWRRSLWQSAGCRIKTDMKFAGDLELWNRFFQYEQLFSIDCLLGAFRTHDQQKTSRALSEYNAEAEQILDLEIKKQASESASRIPPAPIPITQQQIDTYILQAGHYHPINREKVATSTVKRGTQPSASIITPLVTAIVSTYNSERFIRGCLEDLFDQSISDRLEVIVVDSASEQKEKVIVRELQQQYPNIKYICTPKRESVYAAWNRGIKLARGKYITNANTDDRHRKNAFEKMVAVLEAEPQTALVYADVITTATGNETFDRCTPTGMLRWYDWDREKLLTEGCFIGPQPMWRRSVHDLYGYFDESLNIASDYDFWLRISQTYDFKHIAKPMGLYLDRPDSVEHSNAALKKREDVAVNKKYRLALVANELIDFKPFASLSIGNAHDRIEAIDQISDSAHMGGFYFVAQIKKRCREMKALLIKGTLENGQIQNFIEDVSRFYLHRDQDNDGETSSAAFKGPASIGSRGADEQSTHVVEGSPESKQLPFDEMIYQGIYFLIEDGHMVAAQWMLDKFFAEYGDFAQAHHDRAILALNLSDTRNAETHFKRAAELAPGNASIQKSWGDFCHVYLGQNDLAVIQFQKVLQLTPNDKETILTMAHLCVSMQRFDEACEYYERVLMIDSANADAGQYLEKLRTHMSAPEAQRLP